MASHQFLQKNRRQGGYTIIELGIALAIVAVLIIGGLAGVTAVLDSARANDQISSSGRTIAKLQNVVSTSATLQNLDTTQAIGLSLFPNNRVNAARTGVVGVFSGGSEFIATNGVNAVVGVGPNIPINRAGFYVIHNIPRAVCTDVALALAPLADSAWVIAVPAPQGAIADTPPVANIIRTNGAAVAPVVASAQCNLGNRDLSSLVLLIRP